MSPEEGQRIFKKFAPRYQALLRAWARRVWQNKADMNARMKLFDRIRKFRDQYARELHIQTDRKPDVISHVAKLWFEDQRRTVASIDSVVRSKKETVKKALVKQLSSPRPDLTREQVQEQLDALYLTPEERETVTVGYVKSYAGSVEKRINQMAEQATFDMARDANTGMMKEKFTMYRWETRKDSRVRHSHRKLQGKIFLFNNDPTIIYPDRTFRGGPGEDYGCRCWMVGVREGKPLLDYVVREKG